MATFALANPTYTPAMRVIIAITRTNPLQVTTSIDRVNPAAHGYIDGLIVRLDIPPGFGMFQVDQQFAPITVTSAQTFTMPIDATMFDAFVFPATFPEDQQEAQCVPFAELNSQLTGATQNVL